MTDLQASMIAEARKHHGEIFPCSCKRSLEECFTDEGKYGLFLYYNTPDGHTHVIRRSPACTG